jgi:PAS domain S-box-containing protein/putative nucleotidyltransferase with HDIG domain
MANDSKMMLDRFLMEYIADKTRVINGRLIGNANGRILPSGGLIPPPPMLSPTPIRRSKKELKTMVDYLPAVVFKGYLDGTMEFFDDKVEALTGYGKRSFESRRIKWTDLVLEADLAEAKKAFIKALKGDKSYIREYRIKDKSGNVVWLQERSTIVCDSHGMVQYIIGMLLDITPQKQAESDIHEGEQFLSSIYANIQDGITLLDFDLRILQANPTMEKWHADAMPLVGKKCYQAYQANTEPCRPCPAHRTLITGKPHYETMARKADDGKKLRWMDVYSFPWRRSSDGKIIGVVMYVRDITKRLDAEEALAGSLKKLRKTLNAAVSALATTVETRDPYTSGHQSRVARLACAIAQEMGVSQDLLEGLQVMGFLHDIGKIGVPVEILCKPSELTQYEHHIIRSHPKIGYEILKGIEFPWQVANTVLQHHERLDGSGYPEGRSSEDIILEAKIIAVADVTEAMASHRPYRPAVGLENALKEISLNCGTLYDPEVVNACLRLFTEKGFIL